MDNPEVSSADYHRRLLDTNQAMQIGELLFNRYKDALQYSNDAAADEHCNPETLVQDIKTIIDDLRRGKPVEYILGQGMFMGMVFRVNDSVLIPRPVTEDLVEHIFCRLGDHGNSRAGEGHAGKLVDIGTGSGCIAIALKRKMQQYSVTGTDVSSHAIEIARLNAAVNEAKVDFIEANFMRQATWKEMGSFDVIVSNPPYLPIRKKEAGETAVFEPFRALFVQTDEPLRFYQKILAFSIEHLNAGGHIFLETAKAFVHEVAEIFQRVYTSVEVLTDRNGIERFVMVHTKKGRYLKKSI